MLAKLKEHEAEFRTIHVTVIDLIDDDDTLITEQALLDEHDDLVASVTVRIMTLADSPNVGTRPHIERRRDKKEGQRGITSYGMI